jgi:acyl transferase domain-containing protein
VASEEADAPLRVSINNFGFGGSNAHVILEKEEQDSAPKANGTHFNGERPTADHLDHAPTTIQDVVQNPSQVQFFPCSGKDEVAAKAQASALLEFLGKCTWKNDDSETQWLADLSYTLRNHRNHFDHQFAIPASSVQELIDSLTYSPVVGRSAGKNKSVFVMTGQESQWAGMAVSAMPLRIFAEAMSKADQYLRDLGCEWSLLSMFMGIHLTSLSKANSCVMSTT